MIAAQRNQARKKLPMISGLENPLHILLILVVVLMVFGGKRLPELARSLGSGMREFKDSISGKETDSPSALPKPNQDA
jgi:TatA/E family protein of Tat protein translocase